MRSLAAVLVLCGKLAAAGDFELIEVYERGCLESVIIPESSQLNPLYLPDRFVSEADKTREQIANYLEYYVLKLLPESAEFELNIRDGAGIRGEIIFRF